MSQIDKARLVAHRKGRALELMESRGLDVLLATSFDNVRYLNDVRPFFVTGWMPNAMAVLTKDGDLVTLYPDEFVAPSPIWRDEGRILAERYGWSHFTIFNPAMVANVYMEWLDWALRRLGIRAGRLGLDAAPWQWHAALTDKFPHLEVVDVQSDLLRLRAIKSQDEVALLRQAAKVASEAVTRGLSVAQEGAREDDILGAAMGELYRQGSEGDAFFPFLTCGPVEGAALYPAGRELRIGDPVILDLGPIIDGYMGDCMRTTFIGAPTDLFVDMYRTIYDATYAGVQATRPGVKASTVDAEVRRVMRQRGYDVHRFDSGHGVGLNCCELPILIRADAYSNPDALDMTLQPGMVFTIEPRLYKQIDEKTFLQVALEEMVLVTERGCEVITTAPFLEEIVEPRPLRYEQ